MRTVDALASLQARAPVEIPPVVRTNAVPSPPAVSAPVDTKGSNQSHLKQGDAHDTSKQIAPPPIEYGPPDRDGNGWLDPPAPTELGKVVDARL